MLYLELEGKSESSAIKMAATLHGTSDQKFGEDKSESSAIKMAAGGTTLHGTSDQKFGAAQSFKPYASKAVVYSVRLVADADEKISPQTWGQCLHLSKAGAAQEEI